MARYTDSLKASKSMKNRTFWVRIAGKLAILLFLTFLFIKFSAQKVETSPLQKTNISSENSLLEEMKKDHS